MKKTTFLSLWISFSTFQVSNLFAAEVKPQRDYESWRWWTLGWQLALCNVVVDTFCVWGSNIVDNKCSKGNFAGNPWVKVRNDRLLDTWIDTNLVHKSTSTSHAETYKVRKNNPTGHDAHYLYFANGNCCDEDIE